MKRIFILIVACLFLAAYSSAYAHPPSDIIITFDPKTKILNALIMHNVSNPANHFVKKVDIALNGQEVILHNLSRQDNNVSQAVSYLIPDVKAGDTISVEAYCSISGELKKEILVSETPSSP